MKYSIAFCAALATQAIAVPISNSKRGEDIVAYNHGLNHIKDEVNAKRSEDIAAYGHTPNFVAGEETAKRSNLAAYMPGGHFKDIAGEETAKRGEDVAAYGHLPNFVEGEESVKRADDIRIYKSAGRMIQRLSGEKAEKRENLAVYMPQGHLKDVAGEQSAKREENIAAYGNEPNFVADEETAKHGKDIRVYKSADRMIQRLSGEKAAKREDLGVYYLDSIIDEEAEK